MATSITTNLNDADEFVLNRLTTEYNTTIPAPNPTLSPAQFFREHIRTWIRSQASRFRDRDQLGMRSAYELATPAEQAQIDTLLSPYRSLSR